MTISVLIPVKGKAVYLEQALESIHRSDLLPNETLIINDGIDQLTLEKIENKFKDINLKILQNNGQGLVSALNTGLYASRSNFIARLDSDDLVENNRLRIQMNFLEDNQEVAVVGSQVTYIDSKNNFLGHSKYPIGNLKFDKKFLKKCLLAHPSVMIRKTTLMMVNGYRETVRFGETSLCEDFDLWRRIYLQGEIVNLPNYLTKYRQHDRQLSSINSSAQTLATLIISSGYFDRTEDIIDIDAKGETLNKNTRNKIFDNLRLLDKVIFLGRIFSFKNSSSTNYIYFYMSKFVTKASNLLGRFN